ncbi:hypothetical protein DL93DRAFT_733272 [Clavulina sp. PMI_390]|nr:hypothetical protein DL93DRAFT_733272 [Clavulina sp. PMI_390]
MSNSRHVLVILTRPSRQPPIVTAITPLPPPLSSLPPLPPLPSSMTSASLRISLCCPTLDPSNDGGEDNPSKYGSGNGPLKPRQVCMRVWSTRSELAAIGKGILFSFTFSITYYRCCRPHHHFLCSLHLVHYSSDHPPS